MQEHIVPKTAISCGWHKPGLEALSGLTPNIIGRAPVHEAGSKIDARLDKFNLWSEAETVLGCRRICLVDCHT